MAKKKRTAENDNMEMLMKIESVMPLPMAWTSETIVISGILHLSASEIATRNQKGVSDGHQLQASGLSQLSEVFSTVTVEDFADIKHQKIFDAARNLFFKSEDITAMKIEQEILQQQASQSASFDKSVNVGDVTVADIAVILSENAGISDLVIKDRRIIKESIEAMKNTRLQRYIQKNIILEVGKVSKSALSKNHIVSVVDAIQLFIDKLRTTHLGVSDMQKTDFSVRDVITQAMSALVVARNQGSYGITTGFKELDNRILGLQEGNLVIVGARPSVGKTAFCTTIAEHIAGTLKRKPVIYSVEMGNLAMGERHIVNYTGKSIQDIFTHGMSQSECEALMQKTSISDGLVYVFDKSTFTEIANDIKQKTKSGTDLIIVDYLQLLNYAPTATTRRFDNREKEIAEITKSFKNLAKSCKVPIILISQLSRDSDKGQRVPRMSDLRDSGCIEQDADLIIFLHRDTITNDSEHKLASKTKLILAKGRNRGMMGCSIYFHEKSMCYRDYPEDEDIE